MKVLISFMIALQFLLIMFGNKMAMFDVYTMMLIAALNKSKAVQDIATHIWLVVLTKIKGDNRELINFDESLYGCDPFKKYSVYSGKYRTIFFRGKNCVDEVLDIMFCVESIKKIDRKYGTDRHFRSYLNGVSKCLLEKNFKVAKGLNDFYIDKFDNSGLKFCKLFELFRCKMENLGEFFEFMDARKQTYRFQDCEVELLKVADDVKVTSYSKGGEIKLEKFYLNLTEPGKFKFFDNLKMIQSEYLPMPSGSFRRIFGFGFSKSETLKSLAQNDSQILFHEETEGKFFLHGGSGTLVSISTIALSFLLFLIMALNSGVLVALISTVPNLIYSIYRSLETEDFETCFVYKLFLNKVASKLPKSEYFKSFLKDKGLGYCNFYSLDPVKIKRVLSFSNHRAIQNFKPIKDIRIERMELSAASSILPTYTVMRNQINDRTKELLFDAPSNVKKDKKFEIKKSLEFNVKNDLILVLVNQFGKNYGNVCFTVKYHPGNSLKSVRWQEEEFVMSKVKYKAFIKVLKMLEKGEIDAFGYNCNKTLGIHYFHCLDVFEVAHEIQFRESEGLGYTVWEPDQVDVYTGSFDVVVDKFDIEAGQSIGWLEGKDYATFIKYTRNYWSDENVEPNIFFSQIAPGMTVNKKWFPEVGNKKLKRYLSDSSRLFLVMGLKPLYKVQMCNESEWFKRMKEEIKENCYNLVGKDLKEDKNKKLMPSQKDIQSGLESKEIPVNESPYMSTDSDLTLSFIAESVVQSDEEKEKEGGVVSSGTTGEWENLVLELETRIETHIKNHHVLDKQGNLQKRPTTLSGFEGWLEKNKIVFVGNSKQRRAQQSERYKEWSSMYTEEQIKSFKEKKFEYVEILKNELTYHLASVFTLDGRIKDVRTKGLYKEKIIFFQKKGGEIITHCQKDNNSEKKMGFKPPVKFRQVEASEVSENSKLIKVNLKDCLGDVNFVTIKGKLTRKFKFLKDRKGKGTAQKDKTNRQRQQKHKKKQKEFYCKKMKFPLIQTLIAIKKQLKHEGIAKILTKNKIGLCGVNGALIKRVCNNLIKLLNNINNINSKVDGGGDKESKKKEPEVNQDNERNDSIKDLEKRTEKLSKIVQELNGMVL